MSSSGGHYIHGSDPAEQGRLSLLNELLNQGSLGALRLARGERVLDVGSGLGQLSRAMARTVGAGGVIGVERALRPGSLHVERRFVALTLAVWDPTDRSLTIANAGCPYPYRVRAGTPRPVAIGGMPAGGLANSRYDIATLTLEPGDLVLFCSDGVEECENQRGETLAERRLPEFLAAIEALPAQRIADDLIALTVEHTGYESAFTDDRPVLAIRGL